MEVKNSSAVLTSIAINTTSYSNISLQFRLASLTDTSAGGGSDVGDSVTLWISLDNGSTWSAEIKVSGRSNARWSYNSGVATAVSSFDGNGSAIEFQPGGGGARTTDGFGIIRLNSIPSVANLKFRISLKNGTANEIWAIDDIQLTGTSGGCSTPSAVSSASSVSHSFSLDAKWTNGSCYDEVVIFMNETSGIQVSPSGTYGVYFGNSAYSTPNQCVYNGVGDSIRVTGLDNGTTYYFEIFTRRNSTWSSGVEISGTPDFNGISFSALNTPLTIDFDNTLTGSNNGTFNGSGFSPSPSSGQLNSSSWSVTGFSDGDCKFDSAKTTGDFARGASSGGVGMGGIYAFQVASGDYALGVQPVAADFTPGEFILRLANETSTTVTNILLEYDVYINNDQGWANSFNISYSLDNQNYTVLEVLDIASDQSPDSIWTKNKRFALIKNLSLYDNSFFYLKWSSDDLGGSGSRDEFALDNIKISLHTSAPSSISISSSDSLHSIKALNIGLTLASSIITDSIRLINSILSIGNNNLIIVDSAFIGNDSSYIQTNGSGRVIKSIKGVSTFSFPVGRTNFSPITLQFTTGNYPNADASVRVIDSIHSGVTASTTTVDYIKRFWNVSSSGMTSFSCNVSANYHDSDIVGTEGNLFMGKWDGTVWDVGSSVSTSNNLLSIAGVTSFSDFTGAGSPLLPVDWLYFRGERKGDFDVLEWATANEVNNQKFVIERSYDNLYFESVNEIISKGNSNKMQEYQTEIKAENGITYYRLTSFDFDGNLDKYQTIQLGVKVGLSFYYTDKGINFTNNSHNPIAFKIIDLSGKIVFETEVQKEYKLTNAMLRKGVYFVSFDENYHNNSGCKKLVVF